MGLNGWFLVSLEIRFGGFVIVNVYDFEIFDFFYKIDIGINDIEMFSFLKVDVYFIGIYGY